MTIEVKQKNFDLFIRKLNQIGIETDGLVSEFGEMIQNGTFTLNGTSEVCGDGTLIEIILKVLTPYAVNLNNLFPEEKRVDQNTLVKVCLLHQIAKAIRIIPNDNQWEIEKRGLLYKYDSNQPSIRTGLHSLIIAQKCGINFSAEEAEAMTINDRDLTDEQSRWHSSILASIVRQASEMTYLQYNDQHK